jgi:membrane fusion protein (multidrug efflux system)
VTPFARTLGALRADRGRAAIFVGGLGVVLLGLWIAWMAIGRVSVYRTSVRARLEVTPAPAQVAAVIGGRVVEVDLAIGARVEANQALVVLDTRIEAASLDRARVRLAAITPELASIDRELEAEDAVEHSGDAGDRETERQALARQRGAEAELARAEEEAIRVRALVDSGALPAAELSRANAEEAKARATFDAAVHEAKALGSSRTERAAGRSTRREQLQRQRLDLEAERTAVQGELEQLDLVIARSTLRAPVAGVLGAIDPVQPGAVLEPGAVIATVVPDGALQVVADYGADAIGRIAPGQPARVRLDGFPWTHYGTVATRVERVSTELRDGVIRVELALVPTDGRIPLAHGMTGQVEIEVEQISPAELLVRTLGDDR